MKKEYILWFKDLTSKNVPEVGGKNASLGEMYSKLSKKGVNVPNGFALTSQAYWYFIKENNLEEKLKALLQGLNTKDIKKLQKVGQTARRLIRAGHFPKDLEREIISAYHKLSREDKV